MLLILQSSDNDVMTAYLSLKKTQRCNDKASEKGTGYWAYHNSIHAFHFIDNIDRILECEERIFKVIVIRLIIVSFQICTVYTLTIV